MSYEKVKQAKNISVGTKKAQKRSSKARQSKFLLLKMQIRD